MPATTQLLYNEPQLCTYIRATGSCFLVELLICSLDGTVTTFAVTEYVPCLSLISSHWIYFPLILLEPTGSTSQTREEKAQRPQRSPKSERSLDPSQAGRISSNLRGTWCSFHYGHFQLGCSLFFASVFFLEEMQINNLCVSFSKGGAPQHLQVSISGLYGCLQSSRWSQGQNSLLTVKWSHLQLCMFPCTSFDLLYE